MSLLLSDIMIRATIKTKVYPDLDVKGSFKMAVDLGRAVLTGERIWLCTDNEALDGIVEYWQAQGCKVMRISETTAQSMVGGTISPEVFYVDKPVMTVVLHKFYQSVSLKCDDECLLHLVEAAPDYDIFELIDYYDKLFKENKVMTINNVHKSEILHFIHEYVRTGDEQAFRGNLQFYIDRYGSELVTYVVHALARKAGEWA